MRGKVASGLAWTYAERISAQLVSFFVSIVLARQVAPEHFGVIAMVTVFISIANVFVTDGFSNALIQKKDASETDFSTVFYISLILSVAIFIILYFCAPFIADFYGDEQIKPVIRVLSIKLIISALNSVQNAYVSKKMIFKKFFFATLIGTIVSAVVGVGMAYRGYGVWALVAQYLTNSTIDTVVLHFTCGWKPRLLFSLKNARSLFSYGSRVLASSLIQKIYDNLRSLIIGKVFSPADLAFYNRGKHIPSLIVDNINTSITKTLFPAMSSVQDDRTKVKMMTRRSMRISAFIMSPLLFGLLACSRDIIKLLLTDVWLPCVPYMQIICLTYVFQPIHKSNLQAIKAIGRSDILLRLEFYKKGIGVTLIVLAAFVLRSVLAIAWSGFIITLINALLNAFPNKKLLNYSIREQILDLLPSMLCSGIMCAVVFAVGLIDINTILLLVLQIVVGICVYILLAKVIHSEDLSYCTKIAREAIGKIRGRKGSRKKMNET